MISIVIPLYNKERSIETTIRSVLAQTVSNFELIVVDDGSTDNGPAIVESIADPRIRLIKKENGGVSSARNRGIMVAKGDCIAFLDADDLWEPRFLAEIEGLLNDFPQAGIVGTAFRQLGKGQDVISRQPVDAEFRGIIDRPWDFGHWFWTSATCCRKTAIIEAGMFDERITHGEDIDLWWRIMLRQPAAFSNKPMATYRLDEDNRAMDKTIPIEKLYINYFEKYTTIRKSNLEFRHFIDKECMWWLFPYYAKNPKDPNLRRILSMIDLKEYKPSFRFRFQFPRLYSSLKKIR